jgi:hypothetical protein
MTAARLQTQTLVSDGVNGVRRWINVTVRLSFYSDVPRFSYISCGPYPPPPLPLFFHSIFIHTQTNALADTIETIYRLMLFYDEAAPLCAVNAEELP